MDVIERLRSNLKHFETNPDFGDPETIEVICRHLRMRIYEAEGRARLLEIEKAFSAVPIYPAAAA
jgi:hypothetical protein